MKHSGGGQIAIIMEREGKAYKLILMQIVGGFNEQKGED